MSHPHDDTAPVEHDPTGMRALLASLPDPGPMPDDLVARISAALEAEAGRADGVDGLFGRVGDSSHDLRAGDADLGTGGRVVPLRRRVQLRHLGVAAAVVGVLGLGGYLVGTLPGGVTASLSAGSADSAASDDSGAGSKAQEGAPLVAPEAGSGEVVVVMSGADHAAARLAVTARELDDGTLDPIADLTSDSPAFGPIATPTGARACADALGIPSNAGILVDVAEVDGVSAAVLVVHAADGRTAWAVDRSCATGVPGLITGPVPLD
ncbi:MAG TPA: hypothetical protein VES93_14510 [Ornithinibacter sp.]|nr:hypothetical protein [Ornithinibacter sp.]